MFSGRFVAASLLSVASTSPSWREISRFVDSNFHTITSAASHDPALGHATAVTNPDMMVHWIDQLINVLGAVRDGIADEDTRYDTESPLADIFVNAWEQKLNPKELYNLATDPKEQTNLLTDPQYQDVLTFLLNQATQAAGDNGSSRQLQN